MKTFKKRIVALLLVVMATVGSSQLAYPFKEPVQEIAQDMLSLLEFQASNLGLSAKDILTLQAIMLVESRGIPGRVGRHAVTSYGIMQVTAATAESALKRFPEETKQFFNKKPTRKELIHKLTYDNLFNITVASLMYNLYSNMVGNDPIRAIAAYNKGPRGIKQANIQQLKKLDYVIKVKKYTIALEKISGNR